MARLKSILEGSNAQVFKKLLLFYRPPPAKIIDVTCGYKHFWDDLKGSIGSSMLDWVSKGQPSYEVVFTDIRPIGDHQVDYRNILGSYPEFEGKFDVVVFDPPYTPLTLRVNGVEKWMEKERYGLDAMSLSEDHFRQFIIQAYRLTKKDGIVITKLQDTINWWHFWFWKQSKPFKLEALYIHNLGQNWAENVEVKSARKPIPMHAYWFILVK